jgi:hypothetical protein
MMKLSDIENPLTLDSSKRYIVKTARGEMELVGYSPAGCFADFGIFHLSGGMIKDGEVIRIEEK